MFLPEGDFSRRAADTEGEQEPVIGERGDKKEKRIQLDNEYYSQRVI